MERLPKDNLKASFASCRERLIKRPERTAYRHPVPCVQHRGWLAYISTLQEELVRADFFPAEYGFAGCRELVGMQPGDVSVTYADSEGLGRDFEFTPKTDIQTSLRAFVEWYYNYFCRKEDHDVIK